MISLALLLILLLLLIHLKLVDLRASWYVFEEIRSKESTLYFEFFSATMPELPHPYYTYKKVLAETKCSRLYYSQHHFHSYHFPQTLLALARQNICMLHLYGVHFHLQPSMSPRKASSGTD